MFRQAQHDKFYKRLKNALLTYTPTPIQEIHDPLFEKAGVRVLVKREDLNHPHVSGNKWWKLKYNLEEAIKLKHRTLLTFGGAYSNHIYATAAAAHELELKSIGIIRGEETLPLNETLSFAKSCGMRIHYVSREAYRKKTENEFLENLRNLFGEFYLIPEGGTNELAVKGVTEFAQTLGSNFDYLCCAVGSGGTLAGLINGLDREKELIGFPVLKGADFLKAEIEHLLPTKFTNWRLIPDYHYGGYAKTTPELNQFIRSFNTNTNILIEPIYTGKLLAGVYDLISKGYFTKGSIIFVLHSGGIRNQ
jgi:1-aminocyclopropane-1-carboxylate deaminase